MKGDAIDTYRLNPVRMNHLLRRGTRAIPFATRRSPGEPRRYFWILPGERMRLRPSSNSKCMGSALPKLQVAPGQKPL